MYLSGTVRDRTCSITRSIPAHGINAGQFPPNTVIKKTEEPVKTIISSNGYYGFKPNTNGVIASQNDDCDMETDSAPITNGHENKIVSNGSSLDVTLSREISQNQVPIGGRKRSREDSPAPEMKRTRREGNVL